VNATTLDGGDHLIEGGVLRRVDEILARVGGGTELEIIRYAA